MRIAVTTLFALLLFMCEEEPAAVTVSAEPEVEASATIELPAPAHGGVVLAAGPHPMEVVATDDGTVDAYFVGPPPADPTNVTVTVDVPLQDAPPRPTMLIWDPSAGRMRGRVHNATIAPEPIQIRLVVDGHPYRARAPQLVIVHPSAPATTVVIQDDDDGYVEEGGPAAVVVEGPAPPRPVVVVHAEPPRAPQPRVVIRGPAPPPRPPGHRVVIEGPAPPGPPGHRVVVEGGPHPGRGHARGHRRGRRARRGRRGRRRGRH